MLRRNSYRKAFHVFAAATAIALASVSGAVADDAAAQDASTAKETQEIRGLGDPGNLVTLIIETGRSEGEKTTLLGSDAREQLVVTGKYDSGQVRDLIQSVTYSTSPAGIVQIDETALVTPLADGEVTVTALSADGKTAQTTLSVVHFNDQVPVNFPNQITPIFTKLACNSGGCHGKASG